MQAHLERGRAASGLRSVGYFAILAGAPLIAALALLAPDPALARCGTTSRPAGVRPATTSTGVHAPTSAVTSGAGGGGGGTLGCANGSSASGAAAAVHGLPVATSGRVVQGGVRSAARTATHPRTPTRTTNAGAHAVRPAHRV